MQDKLLLGYPMSQTQDVISTQLSDVTNYGLVA